MIVLHGGFGEAFFIWGERSFTRNGLHNLRRMRRVGDACVVDHPWDAGVEQVLAALREIGFEYGGDPGGNRSEIGLPTFAQKYPIPSTPLLGEIPRTHIKRPMEHDMRMWRVHTLPLEAVDVLELSRIVPREAGVSQDGLLLAHGVMMALDLCYIVECCHFAVSLLERGRFLPDVRLAASADGEPRYESRWRPLLIGDDAERFGQLIRMMPPILRSYSSSPESISSAESVICELFDRLMDGIIRHAWTRKFKSGDTDASRSHRRLASALIRQTPLQFDSTQAERRKRGKLVNALNPHALWVRSLGWLGDAEGLSQSLESIYLDVRDWWRRFEWFAKAPFKVCVEMQDVEGNTPAWRLEYFIKYLPTGETVPARDVWNCRGFYADGISGDYMRRYLLLLLGRIGSNVPAVQRSLEQRSPTGCTLSLEEAADFLKAQAQELIGKGITVVFPDWWEDGVSDHLSLCGRLCSGTVDPAFCMDDGAERGDDGSAKSRLSFRWELAMGGVLLSQEETAAVLDGRMPLLRIQNRWYFAHPHKIERIRNRMENLPTELTAQEAVRLAVSDPFIDGFCDAPVLEEIYASLREGRGREMLDTPRDMQGTLRPYQQRGYSWLSFLSRLGLGACLADDMGLGKTVQTLALVQYYRDRGERRPVLLICPTSVLENWRIEMERFFPHMTSYLHHGRGRARGADFAAAVSGRAIVLSSYALLQRDAALYQSVAWAGVVLDEAQNIKNPDTHQARAARSIKADWRVVLTGTPIENHVGDLWSIMEFLMPGMLGGRHTFACEYTKPIQEGRDSARMEMLKRLVSPFIMRRMKTDRDIAPDLPEKIETKVFCGLKKEQVALYSDVTAGLSRDLTGVSGIQRKGMVLAGLTRIKQICDHPSLVAKDDDFSSARSAKLERMMALAEEMFAAGDRTIIFTQYVEMGHILKSQLQERFGKEVLFLHGSVFKDARDRMIRRFQEGSGPQFFVLSLKAGGVGLNLTGANHVVMYDRWWNPAVEQQAIDRAYRIGQTRNVHVHIFCCRGTLEERIDELIASKMEVASRVIENGDNWVTELSDRELQRLLSLSPKAMEA